MIDLTQLRRNMARDVFNAPTAYQRRQTAKQYASTINSLWRAHCTQRPSYPLSIKQGGTTLYLKRIDSRGQAYYRPKLDGAIPKESAEKQWRVNNYPVDTEFNV